MDSWAELRPILEHLSSRPDRPLQGWPDPRVAGRRPPFRIRLAPWASGLAAQLHERFGDDVDLTVGALHYPERRRMGPAGSEQSSQARAVLPLLPSDSVSVSLDDPITVASGDTITAHVRVHNHQRSAEVIVTNGHLTARILDSRTGDPVGGYAGA